MTILKVENLEKTFKTGFRRKPQPVLKGVSFEIPQGTINGFLGQNGAGKTTTIKCIFEICYPDAGNITFFGSEPISPAVRSRIGFLPERPYFYDYLTGIEFLRFYGELSRSWSKNEILDRAERLLKKVDLFEAKNKPLRTYSKGMLQRIGIAQALLHEPEFVVLDEPMSGLDPDGRLKVSQIIKEVAEGGTTVFFSSHLLHDMELLCDRLVILRDGVTHFQGSTKNYLDRLKQGYKLTYQVTNQNRTETVFELVAVQKMIDKLRSEGAEILEVRAVRPTLEEAFVDLIHGGRQN